MVTRERLEVLGRRACSLLWLRGERLEVLFCEYEATDWMLLRRFYAHSAERVLLFPAS